MKKPINLIIIGAVLLTLGVLVPIVAFFGLIFDGSAKAFLVPGSEQIVIEKPGRYLLWNDFNTIYSGKTYRVSEELPQQMELSLTDLETGQEIPIFSSLTTTVNKGSAERSRSIGYFNLEPGTYELQVAGDFSERVFSFGKSLLKKIMLVVASVVIIGVILIGGGLITLVFGLVGIIKKDSVEPSPS